MLPLTHSTDRPPPPAAGPLFTDLYELTMLQAYDAEAMDGAAVFELFFRELPSQWNYVVAAGVEQAIRDALAWRFSAEELSYLRSTGKLSRRLIDRLEGWRFTGDIDAVAEGTPVFGHEPIARVEAPIFDAQLLETLMINRVMFPSLAASKASRIVHAAAGRNVVDFGARRAHGPEAAMAVARSSYLAGFSATSFVEAGRRLGIPVTGTMAHSYILAHDDEAAAFEAFMREFPETVLLVDTYDTLAGVEKVIEIANRLGDDFKVRAIRLDSGDMAELSKQARRRLDDAGLNDLEILASSGLDEFEIARLVGADAPIDSFGVGTKLAVSDHAPHIDIAYKLVQYDGQPRMKLSSDKANPPGAKQVFRVIEDGEMRHDILARKDEEAPPNAQPLLQPVVRAGKPVENALPDLNEIREHAAEAIGQLPGWLRGVKVAEPPYRVQRSDELNALAQSLRASIEE